MEKICIKCRLYKPFEDFYLRKDSKDGRRNDCVVCHLENKKIYSIENSQRRKDYMKQYRIDKPDTLKVWLDNHPNYKVNYMKEYRKDNPEKVKFHKTKNRKKRLENDPKYRLKNNVRRLILLSFSKNGYSKNSKTNKILGIDYDGFMRYIESKFTGNMSWENRGEWELDHKVPLSLGKTEMDIVRLNHYSNFQPLWRKENSIKSDKLLDEYKHLINEYII
jgi:hypothetical protein